MNLRKVHPEEANQLAFYAEKRAVKTSFGKVEFGTADALNTVSAGHSSKLISKTSN